MSDEEDLGAVAIEIPVEEGRTEIVPDKKPEAVVEDTSALADLKAQIEAHKEATKREREAREAAERKAREEAEKAKQASVEVQDNRLTSISNALKAATSEAEIAERALVEALRASDYDAAGKAQRLIAAAEAKILQLENGKAALEEQKREAPKREEPKRNDVDSWIDSLSPRSADWMRSHREFVGDQTMMNKIGAAHNFAVSAKGILPDSDEYFAFIEESIGLRKPEAEAEPAPKPKPQKITPSAPVVNGKQAASVRGEVMTLSPEMRQVAWELYSDRSRADAERQYAIDRANMIKSGRLAS